MSVFSGAGAMGSPDPNSDRHYTYADYLTWPDDERWEIIEGRAHKMYSDPPVQDDQVRHQQVVAAFISLIWPYFIGKPCQVFPAPLDVRLPEGKSDSVESVDTVVQPDVMVVCDPDKLDEKGVRGAPELIIEIITASSVMHDMGVKPWLYEKHGVRCYLIVDPWSKTITARYLDDDGRYSHPETFSQDAQMPVRIFDGLVIDLSRVFDGI